jgi:hypothetical protein
MCCISAVYAGEKDVDFNRDIRPILSSRCFQCHGPDDGARKAGLRLDMREEALKGLKSSHRAIVPGDPAKSELLARITRSDDENRMPPAKTGSRLTPEAIARLRAWIDQGAAYKAHWSYAKPVRPSLPIVQDRSWPINPIDYFILARLEREGLRPNSQADKYALIRRVSIDLTGLPPTTEEADRFVNDPRPDAYERAVDRLLASLSFGERWAAVWLDLARYADSQGYANDPDRTIWRWRDWVIEALNHNMPFDEFTIEQLAGDLLPNTTTSQQIATGFHRNTLTNTEGGTNAEEFRSAAVVDRVNTTMQVWMGTTINCCQCHNHKYDPISQKEFYQLYAIFNQSEDANGGNDAPTINAAVVGHDTQYRELEAKLEASKKKFDEMTKQVDTKRAEWEKTVKVDTQPKEIAAILAKAADKRDAKEKDKLTAHFRSLSADWKALDAEVRELTTRVQKISTTVPVLKEGKGRVTNIHIRGNFQNKGEEVKPGLPSAFPAPSKGEPMNRLTLARWLVSPENPLTARVAVNRLWEEIFGIGIVETSEEFGMQGELPTHPELLDWLATEYMRLGWDTKAMLKLIVTSATYRQSSQIRNAEPGMRNEDPNNRLLSHGPRVRLSAEEVRDQALFVSGLLSPKMYGPPVQPPRPNFGLSAAFGSTTDWQTSNGEDKYRRALYIRIRRNAPYPSMTTFDAPERTYCNIRRLRTNTPLQALVTLNDPVYIEAAQALARRIVTQGGESTTQRMAFVFRLCETRPPTEAEVKRLTELFEQAKAQFAKEPAKATALVSKPLGPPPAGMKIEELAAWTVVSNVLLNLDETLAKR